MSWCKICHCTLLGVWDILAACCKPKTLRRCSINMRQLCSKSYHVHHVHPCTRKLRFTKLHAKIMHRNFEMQQAKSRFKVQQAVRQPLRRTEHLEHLGHHIDVTNPKSYQQLAGLATPLPTSGFDPTALDSKGHMMHMNAYDACVMDCSGVSLVISCSSCNAKNIYSGSFHVTEAKHHILVLSRNSEIQLLPCYEQRQVAELGFRDTI